MRKLTTLMLAALMIVGMTTMAVAGTLDPGTLDDACSTCETEMSHINRGCEYQDRDCGCFNYEDFGGSGENKCSEGSCNSYCTGEKGDQHKAIFSLCTCLDDWQSGLLPEDTLNISMEIVVKKSDGIIYTGDNGVYWCKDMESDRLGVEWEEDKEDHCEKDYCQPYDEAFYNIHMIYDDDNPEDSWEFETVDGLEDDPWGNIESDAKDLLARGRSAYAWVDIPSMELADDSVDREGWEVWVKVCLLNTRVFQCDPCCCLIPIGILCCEDPVLRTSAVYPYFTQMNDASWWFGMAITNYGDEAGVAEITLYEQDGDIATGEVDLAAHGLVVLSITDLMAELTLTTGGTLGDSACYIEVVGDGFPVTGMGMMAKPSTGESMGYVPIAGMESSSNVMPLE
jgi:hypothetical protein